MPESWELSVVQIKPDHTRATCKTERPAMSGSNGLQRYNGVEQDDEGAYVYYDEHIAALRRAKAEGRIKSMWEAVHIANTYNCDHNHGKKATEAVDNVLLKLYDRIAELEADARAAQIEEGE